MTAQAKREALATLIRANVPTTWSVYSQPPLTLSLPAIVVAPRGSYRSPVTFTEEAVRLALQVIVRPADESLDAIDTVLDTLIRGSEPLLDTPSLTEVAVAGVSAASASGADVIVATVNVTVS